MGITASFMPNLQYDLGSLNSIGDDLMALTSTAFATGIEYGITDLNEITEILISKGVSKALGNACMPTKVGSDVKILNGLAFFGNGVRVKIDTEGILLPFTAGIINYIYILCDTATNIVEGKCETTEPVTGDYVMIGEVTANGDVVDKREYAVMKNPSVLPNLYDKRTITLTAPKESTSIQTLSVDPGIKKVKLVRDDGKAMAFFDLEVNKCFGFYSGDTASYQYITTYGNMGPVYIDKHSVNYPLYTRLEVTLVNDLLTLTVSNEASGSYNKTYTLEVF